MSLYLFFGLVFAAFIAWLLFGQLKRSRRHRLFLKPLAPEYIEILSQNVSLYALLSDELKQELHGRINIFLDEKEFIGCAGLEITNEIYLTVAGNACLLLLKRDKRCFPGFRSILMYPDTYIAKEVKSDGMVQSHGVNARAGVD